MQLEGSCHCGGVHFTLQSQQPCPFNFCYCSVCRKTAGGGGYAINLGGEYESMSVTGTENLTVYQALISNPHSSEKIQSPAQRCFCRICGSALWLWDPRWPELVHPHASAIDTELPEPPQRTHMMLASKADWVLIPARADDKLFDEYPDESLAEWHKRHGL